METEHCKCDLCGADDYVVLWDKSEREKQNKLGSVVIRDNDRNIINGRNVICKRCGLVYVTPRMTSEELDRFYTEDYRKVYKSGNSLEAEKRHAKTSFKLISGLHGKHLDIGCSTGHLIKMTGGYGIEPNYKHYKIAESAGLNVENCTIEGYSPGFKFDIVTMLNTLEHVTSPTSALSKIYNLLNDDGYVLVSVPDLYNLTIHIGVDPFLSNAHLFNFGIETLSAYFCKCGIKPLQVTIVVEEVGDKIYMLGKKTEKQDMNFNINEQAIFFTSNHLHKWDEAHGMKLQIARMGFR